MVVHVEINFDGKLFFSQGFFTKTHFVSLRVAWHVWGQDLGYIYITSLWVKAQVVVKSSNSDLALSGWVSTIL